MTIDMSGRSGIRSPASGGGATGRIGTDPKALRIGAM